MDGNAIFTILPFTQFFPAKLYLTGQMSVKRSYYNIALQYCIL